MGVQTRDIKWKTLEKAGKTIMALVEKSGSMDVLLYELSTATSLCVSTQQCMEHLQRLHGQREACL